MSNIVPTELRLRAIDWWRWTIFVLSIRFTLMKNVHQFMRYARMAIVAILAQAAIGVLLAKIGEKEPALPEKWPVLWAYFEGWTTAIEFAMKEIFSFVGALLEGRLWTWYPAYVKAFVELVSQFVRWLTSLTF